VIDLVEVEHSGGVFHAEAAASEDDDVVADVGVEDVLGGESFGGFLADLALEGGAAGEEGGVAGKGGAVLRAVTEEGGDLGEESGGQVAAVFRGVSSGGFEGGAEEVDLSGGMASGRGPGDGFPAGWLRDSAAWISSEGIRSPCGSHGSWTG
jgi:hypothetical protein